VDEVLPYVQGRRIFGRRIYGSTNFRSIVIRTQGSMYIMITFFGDIRQFSLSNLAFFKQMPPNSLDPFFIKFMLYVAKTLVSFFGQKIPKCFFFFQFGHAELKTVASFHRFLSTATRVTR
jgi:hypothetical protein